MFEIFKEIGIITLFVFVFGVIFSCIKWIADKEKYYIEDEETNGNEWFHKKYRSKNNGRT